jgi:uncharacterized protein YdeI (YjbR/CyaY-like superfamily)
MEKLFLTIKQIIEQFPFEKTIKWRQSVYMYNGQNISAVNKNKKYVSVWFFQGALIEDRYHILINAQENKTQAMRQLRFYSELDLKENELKYYLSSAIENVANSKKLILKARKIHFSDFLNATLNGDSLLLESFNRLSKSKQNDYHEYINSAKQEKTKISRLKNIIPLILEGKSFQQLYKKKESK